MGSISRPPPRGIRVGLMTMRQAFDALFVKRRMVVAMEFKGGFLPQNARYSNDLDTFMSASKDRIGLVGDQLARDIGALFPRNWHTEGTRKARLSRPTRYLFCPCSVAEDPMLPAAIYKLFS